jgi:hypothetical protein
VFKLLGRRFVEKWIRIHYEDHSEIDCKTENIGGNQIAFVNVVQP